MKRNQRNVTISQLAAGVQPIAPESLTAISGGQTTQICRAKATYADGMCSVDITGCGEDQYV